MGNRLDDVNGNTMDEGRDINVISRVLPVELSLFERILPELMYILGGLLFVLGIFISFNNMGGLVLIFLGIFLIAYVYMKLKASQEYFYGLEQRINSYGSEIDNYMEQRVLILENARDLIDKSIEVDEKIFLDISRFRSGNFTERENNLRDLEKNINVALESYPNLKSQDLIKEGMNQNSYLQKEITSQRTAYNDAIYQWNRDIFDFPFNKIVAGREGFETRIPFIAPREVKEKSRDRFFK